MSVQPPLIVERSDFDQLLQVLRQDGYRPVGQTIREAALVNGELTTSTDLPVGWTNEQAPGRFRLAKRSDAALFGYVPGSHSWKPFLHPPRRRVWRATRTETGIALVPEPVDTERLAFIGVRPCELHAIRILDRALDAPPRNIFIVGVNCGQAGGTCFCSSMGTGPRASSGFDVALTELIGTDHHRFLVEIGTERGASVMARVPASPATPQHVETAADLLSATAAGMGRTMNEAVENAGVKALLYRNLDHPRWDEVAERCLGCANCTMVCPTCFCSTVEDVTDLAGDATERWQRWDSCFTSNFSYIHGGDVRASSKARYRQWLVHKLAAWFDQFGTSGCVGCGRCITWCPAGIDITEEVQALRDTEKETRHANA